MPKTYILGNWKMNQKLEDIKSFLEEWKKSKLKSSNFGIAPQSIHITTLKDSNKSESFIIGVQNLNDNESGAFTGEISAQSLKEFDIKFALIGHSERRAYYDEDNRLINRKVKMAMKHDITPVLCVGESLAERESNRTLEVVLNQIRLGLDGVNLSNSESIIIAYEPVWAIGTGKTASSKEAQEVHASIRKLLIELYSDMGKEISILYGGSVKPSNINDLLSMNDINGALVGGASLKAADFIELCKAAK